MAEEESKKTEKVETPTAIDLLDDFVASGRTGRRNALPDILDEKHATVSTGELPFGMEKLKCSDADKNINNKTESTVTSEEKSKNSSDEST